MTIEELIERSHAMAVEKGWWPEEGRTVVDQVNNFSSEILESWEEYRKGCMDNYWSKVDEHGIHRVEKWDDYYQRPDEMIAAGWKVEGFWIEIGDLLIRLADTMGAYSWKYQAQKNPCPGFKNLPVFIHYLGDLTRDLAIGEICEEDLDIEFSNDASWIACCIISDSLETAKRHGVDLLALCELKMKYNATRSFRHGNKRA